MKKIMLGIMLVLFAIAAIADTVVQETDIQATATTTSVVEPVLISENLQCNQFREIRAMKLVNGKIIVLSKTKVCITKVVKEYNDWCTYNGMITTIYNYGAKQKSILQGKYCENRRVVGSGIVTPLPVTTCIGNCTI